jgi:hypothetical protein
MLEPLVGSQQRRIGIEAMIAIDDIIKSDITDSSAIELAYGLLWMVGCDRSTKAGEALYLARKALYERLDRAGQARGITAARSAIGVDHIRPMDR